MPVERFGTMETGQEDVPLYWIWGVDFAPYGPVELPGLIQWLKDERVVAETWVFAQATGKWLKANQVPELKMFFRKRPAGSRDGEPAEVVRGNVKLKPNALRRIKIFSDLEEDQLHTVLKSIEVVPVRPGVHIVHKGETGEAMYLVLEGELRSSLFVDGTETPVATLGPGSVFGEISVLDRGPHTVDVISNQESIVLQVTGEAFDKIVSEAPQVTLALLLSLSKALAGRVRVLTRRYEDSVHLSQRAEAVLA